MYELEIETRTTFKKIKEPRKARIRDFLFFEVLEVIDVDGKWHKVCTKSLIAYKDSVISKINKAIKERKNSVYIDI